MDLQRVLRYLGAVPQSTHAHGTSGQGFAASSLSSFACLPKTIGNPEFILTSSETPTVFELVTVQCAEMPLSVCFIRGRRQQSAKLAGLCTEAAIYRSYYGCGAQQRAVLRPAARRWAQTAAPRAHHEAHVENIRNIGIIAHVDAVCHRLCSHVCQTVLG